MKILCIDTTTSTCSVAIFKGKKIFYKNKIVLRQYTKYIFPMIEDLFKKSKISNKSIDAISFNCGPGNFTGIKVAQCIANSIFFIKKVPILAIPLYIILAETIKKKIQLNRVVISIRYKKKKMYFASCLKNNLGNWIFLKKKEEKFSVKKILNYVKYIKERTIFLGYGKKEILKVKNNKNLIFHDLCKIDARHVGIVAKLFFKKKITF
ncbi:tRNA (adenosine(37)-N6)-threonylcarbamoyltransferase complex dimerization subunit type 1 TsaB [bacterium endosymbiont of Pedicinus badii]|uniref:tRNA (adenosine(37)-N6)-threonylcarbamoyltransferase complex dimerization subunit type 1 TsaB n=1 Tax=bacterium endosymbiont of Pedicinus badii TaxID=1719126 RepID=UPI0009BA72F1|nr:tRNA (adenosine(37)-N6)-threonylcarbamoyltransferase complex dimerization subunit type 1 TsaB [bacterium endosymbiont of Pedicinus badii]OQM34417.1 hypothetical protein AOQ89_00820 [bacterium endosymbiont of Pedicinus badii]